MRLLANILCFGCAVVVSSPTLAAVVQPVQGTLSLNQGQGFSPINGAINAKVGDSLMVAPGGSATVVYEDGCKVDIRPGAVTTIAPLSPCAAGSNAQSYEQSSGWNWGAIVVGGLAAGGAGWGIYEATKSSGSGNPTSP